MRTRAFLIGSVLILVALMLTLSPLAYASPPDPTWISGLWDDDDFDNVVEYITSTVSSTPPPIDRGFSPATVLVVLQLPAVHATVATVPLSASGPRAPPTS